jgi:hypothetical protein
LRNQDVPLFPESLAEEYIKFEHEEYVRLHNLLLEDLEDKDSFYNPDKNFVQQVEWKVSALRLMSKIIINPNYQ